MLQATVGRLVIGVTQMDGLRRTPHRLATSAARISRQPCSHQYAAQLLVLVAVAFGGGVTRYAHARLTRPAPAHEFREPVARQLPRPRSRCPGPPPRRSARTGPVPGSR